MSENCYKIFFDKLADAVFICKLNYGKTLSNFIEVNETACRMTEYSHDELLQLNFLKLSDDTFEQKLNDIIENLLDGKQVSFDFNLITKQQNIIPSEINTLLFDLNGKPAVLFSARNILNRERTEEKLKQTTEQLRNLALHLQSIREEERKNIAREIHDELGQALTVLKIQITLLSRKLKNGQDELREKMENISNLIDRTVDSVQKISSKLRPDILDELGLTAVIEWQLLDFNSVTGIKYESKLLKEELNLDKEKTTAIFRIFQEALTNVARHANATRIKVELKNIKDSLVLEISDNGKGITPNQINNPRSLGLLGMKERALLFGGSVMIKNSMKSGTIVRVEVPLNNNEVIND